MIYIGNNKLVDIDIGNKIIKEIYAGNKLVYKKEWPGLKFTSKNDSSYVKYEIIGNISCDIYYSRDGINWTYWDGSQINLSYDEFIYVWNKSNSLSISASEYFEFGMSGYIEASGNINSMINFSNTLYKYGYRSMFRDCTSLTTAPELPATILAEGCYSYMFYGCTSLTTAPELPATTLAKGCYANMFYGCTSLTTAQELPATTLYDYCYMNMFYGCTSLTTAPELPATILVNQCYSYMFYGCVNLEQIKLYYTGNFNNGSSSFYYWVWQVSKSGTLYYNGSDTNRGVSAIPRNFSVQTF